ncbi:MAG TPA: hypothetical protein VJR89_39825 [Polyangiales bacterium]|nr:hypothetical protein [Polyangiales bacterium]
MNLRSSRRPAAVVALLACAACSGSSDEDEASRQASKPARGYETAGSAAPEAKPSEPSAGDCASSQFESTFAAIQKVIFEASSCTNDMCHGAKAMGGLDLRADVAYENLIEVPSTLGALYRVMPGEPDESFLYNKLRAAIEPESVKIEGSSMPSGMPPLSADHLEVVRRWIEAGAPEKGSVGDSVTGQSDKLAALLGTCLPKSTPVEITPLSAPEKREGVQFEMAPFTLPGGSEVDVCFAQYYDVSDVVPDEFQDKAKGVFFVNGQRVRQDPQSHHLTLIHPMLAPEMVKDPSFGEWACRGGDNEGQSCDPLQQSGCGAGQCASEVKHDAACLGFGPPTGSNILTQGRVAAAQTAQYYQPPREGVYSTFPIKGVVYWNSHSFNLTERDTKLHAWINLYFAKDRQHELETLAVAQNISAAAGTAPFTTKNVCANWVAPQNSLLYNLTSHTHKRGRNFTVELNGKRIYQSAIYSDPVEQMFDPPLRLDAADPAQRTFKYCADFNNGVNRDGLPDLDLVTRLSTMPDRTTCQPVACVAGKVGGACRGADNAACDSKPGAGDGWCDACAITAGQTTEDEMFVLSPSIVRQ